jgi:hypothetical protein
VPVTTILCLGTRENRKKRQETVRVRFAVAPPFEADEILFRAFRRSRYR